MPKPEYRGRIAPSPTGYLHLGHAKTFWTAYTRAKDAGGILVYRDEDIDLQRCRPEFSTAAEKDLLHLGICWDEGPIKQSERLPLYEAALAKLVIKGLAYPCSCSRTEIQQATDARSTPSGEILFPASLRPSPGKFSSKPTLDLTMNYRFRVPDGKFVTFSDLLKGPQSFEAGEDFGDFLVWRKDGMPSYELAVVVDDMEMRITEVVRGEDLLISTARQLLLYEAFNQNPPEFYHESLVKDENGLRLAKRSDSLALRRLFQQGHGVESLSRMWKENS
ncbi:MAG: tRNA glutamyl-Q synthetase [Verrucomicrobiae bacterium]|nr:tRNA glutamyl-Q synthetase [Verrucomicrobiae bacterium]